LSPYENLTNAIAETAATVLRITSLLDRGAYFSRH
jgi:hypothetical protein